MSKRQGGREKAPNDFYPTPADAVLPLIPFLRNTLKFYEPCAGAGDLINHLAAHGRFCVGACDIEPRGDFIARHSCLDLTHDELPPFGAFVTNPPHTRKWLEPIIEHLRKLRPTWLLLPHDWTANEWAAPHLAFCSHIVVIGRMKIFPDSESNGFDNYVWARFQHEPARNTFFHNGRS